MREYVTWAVVLNKEPLRDFDTRYSFLTRQFGKVVGKATSARKITSKLAGHLEPGSLAQVRFIDRNHGSGTQIADALKAGRVDISLNDLRALSGILAEGDADNALWAACTQGKFSWRSALRIMGWDPEGAECERCGKPAAAFYVPRQDFFCASCASKTRPDALILLGNGDEL